MGLRTNAIVCVVIAFLSVNSYAQRRGFSVRDAIEMLTFSDPSQRDSGAKAKPSPGGAHFFVITTRGLIASDEVESSLWLYDSAAVRAFLGAPAGAAPPRGIALATLSAAPNLPDIDSYQSVITDAKWSPDGCSIYFLGQNANAERRLYRASVSGKEVRALTPAGTDVDSFDVEGENVAYRAANTAADKHTMEVASRGELINSDAWAVTGVPLTTILFPDISARHFRHLDSRVIRQVHDDVLDLPCTSKAQAANALSVWIKQDLDQPPTLWATNATVGDARQLWNPNPNLSTLTFGSASVYHWKDKTGYEWTGGLVYPVGYLAGARYPLVIQTYFFMDHQFLADGMGTTAQAAMPLASAGIFVLQVKKRFDHATDGLEASVQLPGFEGAIDQLDFEGLIDRKRVGIIGFSRGCYYVAHALIEMPDRFAAATVADGWDQSYMQHRMFEDAAAQDDPIYGTKPNGDGLKAWIEKAPGFNLDKVRAPIRIEAITPISILSEWELYSSLREQGKPVDLIYFPLGQHILQKPRERMASQQGNVDWFRFWLQGYEDPPAEKAEQYRRWEKLCDLQIAQNPNQPAFCVRSTAH
jgi:hypothetical protein